LRLNCVGTIEDLGRQGITLREGMALTFYSDDLDAKGQPDELLVDGVVSFSEEEHCWVAVIDWSAIHHASDPMRTRSSPSLKAREPSLPKCVHSFQGGAASVSTERQAMAFSAEQLAFLNADYTAVTGKLVQRFVCPITLKDEPEGELCDGHILNDSIKE